MKTKFTFIVIVFITTLFLSSCDKDTDGIGEDPKLNLENYSFSKDGGKIEIYSTRGKPLDIWYEPSIDEKNEGQSTPIIREYEGAGILAIDGGWYTIDVHFPDTIIIQTMPNITGKPRYIPISVHYMHFSKGNYIQEK